MWRALLLKNRHNNDDDAEIENGFSHQHRTLGAESFRRWTRGGRYVVYEK